MSDSANYDVGLTIISIFINVVLASVVVMQLFLYRHEMNSRLRPWLGRLATSDSIKLVPAQTNHSPLMIIGFVNNGEMPALEVDVSYTVVNPTEFEEEKLKFESQGKQFALGKKEVWYNRTKLTDEDYRLATTSILYYALQVKYTDKNKIQGILEIRGHWDKGFDIFDNVKIE